MNMEDEFLNLGLDIIGLGVFNFDFSSLTKESPVIKVSLRLALPGCKPPARHSAVSGMLVKCRPLQGADSTADSTVHSAEGLPSWNDWLSCTVKGQPTTLTPGGHHARGMFAALQLWLKCAPCRLCTVF